MPMSPQQIKAELKKRGLTQLMIARAARPKVSHTQMNRVVWGRDKSPRLRELLSRMLDIPVEQLFPEGVSDTSHAA
jgi:lambda repressor-like predicted transcriptional regulator